jgi:hypothetical protein
MNKEDTTERSDTKEIDPKELSRALRLRTHVRAGDIAIGPITIPLPGGPRLPPTCVPCGRG